MTIDNYIERQLPATNRRRVEYVSTVITRKAHAAQEYRILDVGCGTGELFAIPLAVRLKSQKNISILGIDVHDLSIQRAQQNSSALGVDNIEFKRADISDIEDTYDCVCLIAVLEHLSDPRKMIDEIKRVLRPGGMFVLYIPNGHGAYEMESALYRKLRDKKTLKFICKILRRAKRLFFQTPAAQQGAGGFIINETLNKANNFHVQFFRFKDVTRLLASAGFTIKNIFKPNAITGPVSNRITGRFVALASFDHWLASVLPASLCADWLLVCEKSKGEFGTGEYFSRLYDTHDEPWQTSRRASQRYRYERCLAMIKTQSGHYKETLEIGCAQGQFTELLYGLTEKLTAVDISATAVNRAKDKLGQPQGLSFETGQLPSLKYENDSFDLVVAMEILYYLNAEARAESLWQIDRVLKSGGVALISVNIGQPPYFRIEEFYELINVFFTIKQIDYYYDKIYSFFERIMLTHDPMFKWRTSRWFLSSRIAVIICRFFTKLLYRRAGITGMCILARTLIE